MEAFADESDLGAAPMAVDASKDASVTIEVGQVWPMLATNGK